MSVQFLVRVYKTLLAITLGCMLTILSFEWGDKLEGVLFPVMSPLILKGLIEGQEGGNVTIWSGSSFKLRECNYVRTEWFLGPRGGRKVQTDIHYTDKPEVRRKGEHVWSGIVVVLDEISVRVNSHADVIHKCPYRIWETRTPWYTSGDFR